MSSDLKYTLKFHDGLPIDGEASDRLLGLGDQFVENWEADEEQAHADVKDAEFAERKTEWGKIRPLFASAPKLLSVCVDIARAGEVAHEQRRAELHDAIAEAGGWDLLNPGHQAAGLAAMGKQKIDLLTIAYVAMGAQQAIQETSHGHLPSQVADAYGGQLGFIDEVIGQAWRLDAVYSALEANGDETSGVFVYEIAEPFGERYAKALISQTMDSVDADPNAIAEALFHEDGKPDRPRDYRTLLLQGAQLLGRLLADTPVDVDAEHERLMEALPEGDGDYDDGYRDALQSMILALAQAGVPADKLRDAVTTALDAHTNNAPETAKPR